MTILVQQQLRKLAERATPGPWELQTSNSWRRFGTAGGRFADGDVLAPTTQRGDNHPDLAARQEDMDFIVAADPTTVLALLDEIDRLTVAAKYCEDIDATHENHRETMLYDLALERDQLRAEIERLQEELDTSNANHENAVAHMQSVCAERDQLKAENAELRRDAERYRWLRESKNTEGPSMVSVYATGELDSAIDRMIAKE